MSHQMANLSKGYGSFVIGRRLAAWIAMRLPIRCQCGGDHDFVSPALLYAVPQSVDAHGCQSVIAYIVYTPRNSPSNFAFHDSVLISVNLPVFCVEQIPILPASKEQSVCNIDILLAICLELLHLTRLPQVNRSQPVPYLSLFRASLGRGCRG